jgi:actin-related protein
MSEDNQSTNQENISNKEMNFRLQERALSEKYERVLAQERAEKEQLLQQLQQRQVVDDEDDPSEPYVDHKKLSKKLAKFGEQTQKQTKQEIQSAVQIALREERQSNWLKQNPDFYNTLKHAEKLAQLDPDLAESILEMPESFERQKLVYKNIKALGLDREAPKQPSIQEKVDANRRSPFYQPSGVGSAPYAGTQSDFSPQGQKSAYDKMKDLQARMRLG